MNPSDKTRLRQALKRANKARKFPYNTCGASRHLHMLAEELAKGRVPYMITEEPQHCAEDILVVIAALWKLRSKEKKEQARGQGKGRTVTEAG